MKTKCLNILLITVFLILIISGCDKNNTTTMSDYSNPINIDKNMKIVATYGHGIDSKDSNISNAFKLDGKDVTVNYFIQNGSINCSIGLFVFANGYIQPYKINGIEKNMHYFELKKNALKQFKISFNPVVGQKGDNNIIYFASMLNPQILATKSNQKSFGVNHSINQLRPFSFFYNSTYNPIKVNTQVKNKAISDQSIFLNKSIYSQDFKKDYFAELKVLGDKFEKNNSIIETNAGNKIILELNTFGISGNYHAVVYIDHKPIKVFSDSEYLEFNIKNNSITSKTFEIDTNDLTGQHELYAIIIPNNIDLSMTNLLEIKRTNFLILNID